MSRKTFLILQVEVSLTGRSKNGCIPFKYPGEKENKLYSKYGGKEKKNIKFEKWEMCNKIKKVRSNI